MIDQPSILTRLSKWLGSGSSQGGNLPMIHPLGSANVAQNPQTPTRFGFLRPFAKRDRAIAQLQNEYMAINDLLVIVRDSVERQGRRHDELLGYLSHLPHALEILPESHRAQAETLKAIHQQIEQQAEQQKQLGEILGKMSNTGQDHREHLDTLRQRVEEIQDNMQSLTESIRSVSSAMQSISLTSQSGVQVLEQMQQLLAERQAEMERILKIQRTRLTIIVTIAAALSAIALVSMAIIGTILLNRI